MAADTVSGARGLGGGGVGRHRWAAITRMLPSFFSLKTMEGFTNVPVILTKGPPQSLYQCILAYVLPQHTLGTLSLV